MSYWSEENVELLKKLWAQGLSASQCAARIPGFSRNAVIGKVARLGLQGRGAAMRNVSYKQRRKGPNAWGGSNNKIFKEKEWKSTGKSTQSGKPMALLKLYNIDAETSVPATEDLVIPKGERKTIATLAEQDCRWPIGDPQSADFHFCGKSKVAGLPYCEFHVHRAYQPVPVSRSPKRQTIETTRATESERT